MGCNKSILRGKFIGKNAYVREEDLGLGPWLKW
jgi:hypothetical protein